ncbi:MAG: hypothetical protein Sv326_1207 [Candidatus Fermentimicrarchaeum limneticum]|uniref:Uncharacterized protein n=1 Tax=Fermentimicrarchaeum limneticum TaxID=2795018 RepID=A0A7D6BPF2_FERL1|nr:MAG: hypothetical protein Sv326_1207 [Candidatus Fermentimicrarchaeum limneticum]
MTVPSVKILSLSVFVLLLLPMARALTTNATVTIKNPSGQAVVNSQQMTCTALGSGTFSGSAFDSPTLCGFNTTSANLINRTNTSCAYTYTKNYSAEGAWTANVTFYHTAYENRGVNIDTTNGTVDTQSPPTGQATLDCTANTTCVSDPQCNNTLNESVNMTIYAINWDTTQADCVGYGKLWYPGKTSGSNYYCCGDDGTSDDFAYWSGTTCMYCNNGVNSSTTTKCSATSAYCTGGDSATCQSGDDNYCCYNVGCSSTGATGSQTNMVGGNCTCTDDLCYWGYCDNASWGGAGCYYSVSCSSTGWVGNLRSPPNDPRNQTVSPQIAEPETTLNVTANVSDDTQNAHIIVYNSSVTTPVGSTAICTGNDVGSNQNSSCTFTASAAGCSAGNCTVKIIASEENSDACGPPKYSFHFVNVSFTYKNRNVSPPTRNAPASDPNVLVGNTFVLNCTALTGNASTGINMSFQFNSTTAGWANITTSGGLTTTQTNPAVNVLNGTAYAINVTGVTPGTYWVRCQAFNSTYRANSTAQQVTVTTIPPTINVSAESYPNCGAVFYRVSFYDVNSKLIDSSFSLKVIDPSVITVLTQAALYPNNGTGVYLGSYLLNTSSPLGTWLLKVTESSGVTTGKNFYVVTTCGDGTCTGGENCENCAADCTCSGFCQEGTCYTCSGSHSGTCPSESKCCNCGMCNLGYLCIPEEMQCDGFTCGCL